MVNTNAEPVVGAESPGYSMRAVERVCDLLELLGNERTDVSLARLAAETGLPKATAVRYLAVLENRRFVEKDPESGEYRLGVATRALNARHLESFAERARPHLIALRDRYGETVNLGLLDGGRIMYLDIVESHRAVRLSARPGDRDLVHCTALGKAIAAQLPEPDVETILAAEGMPARTGKTITTPAAFFKELAAVRRRGWAVDDGENEADGRCVAVAVPGLAGRAAMSISAPASRLATGDVPEVAAALARAAARLAPA